MAMVDLAIESDGSPVALADVADRQEISLSYLEQLFGKLRRGGLVAPMRSVANRWQNDAARRCQEVQGSIVDQRDDRRCGVALRCSVLLSHTFRLVVIVLAQPAARTDLIPAIKLSHH